MYDEQKLRATVSIDIQQMGYLEQPGRALHHSSSVCATNISLLANDYISVKDHSLFG